jgi:5-methylcytosine-specific restriction enzyme A
MPTKPPTFRPVGWTPAPNKRPEVHDRFYGTQAWKRIRSEVLKRDGHRCTASDCRTPSGGLGGRLVVDHIIERRNGGADHISNLRTLCPSCDNRRHARKGEGGSKV